MSLRFTYPVVNEIKGWGVSTSSWDEGTQSHPHNLTNLIFGPVDPGFDPGTGKREGEKEGFLTSAVICFAFTLYDHIQSAKSDRVDERQRGRQLLLAWRGRKNHWYGTAIPDMACLMSQMRWLPPRLHLAVLDMGWAIQKIPHY